MRRDTVLFIVVTGVIAAAIGASAFASVERSGSSASANSRVTVLAASSGCAQGFWKNTPSAWIGTFLSPTQTVESVFNVPDAYGLDNATLLEALGFLGGTSNIGAAQILLRAGTAALLNSTSLGYPLTMQSVINQVNSALTSNNRNTMISVAASLDDRNARFKKCGQLIPPGSIVVTKDAQPDDAQDFSFTLTNGITIDQSFSLDDDSDPTLPKTQTFIAPPGSYVLSEVNIPADWNLNGISCSGGTVNTVGPGSRSFNLASAQTISCTFTDAKAATATPTPTNTPTNTATPSVTNTPTDTPTNTPVPPTNTPTDTPTNTPVVPTNTPTDTPTNTPVPPTNTPTDTPTNTPTGPTGPP